MSGWAYRKCKKCGSRVHINSKCECGGDPWGVAKKASKEISRLIDLKLSLLKKIDQIDYECEILKRDL